MSRITKPFTPYGTKATKRGKFPLGQDDIEAILSQHGIKPTKKIIDRIRLAVAEYSAYKYWIEDKPYSQDTKSCLKKMMTQTDRLLNTLSQADSEAWKVIGPENKDIFESGQYYLNLMHGMLNKKLKSMPKGKAGPRRKWARLFLILKLAQIWKEATGKKPTMSYSQVTGRYSGAFFKFLESLCQCLKKPDLVEGLGEAAHRALYHKK